MFRLVHVFDLKPGQNEENFITWLDATLFEQARKFGCLERKTWVFLDGLDEPYGKAKKVTNRPKYINEAFLGKPGGGGEIPAVVVERRRHEASPALE
jgi:hypothetical protein